MRSSTTAPAASRSGPPNASTVTAGRRRLSALTTAAACASPDGSPAEMYTRRARLMPFQLQSPNVPRTCPEYLRRHSGPRGGVREGGGEWWSGRREGGRLHSRGDADRQRQGLHSGGARHHDLLLPPYGAHETLELELKRLRLGSLE